MVKVENNFSNKKEIEVDFKSIQSNIINKGYIKLETEDETLTDVKQEQINIKDEVPTTFTFQSNVNQDAISFQKSNQKPEGIEDDFKSISSNITCATELGIKQEEIYIKDEVLSASIFQSDVDNTSSVNQSFHKTHREKLFACNICDYKSAYKGNVTTHMRIHTGEKPFACDLCDFKSAHRSYLTIHRRIHTGEKPFACDLCDYKSVHKGTLTKHIKSHSQEECSVACGLCDYKSVCKYNLTMHMKSHTVEKPFTCDLCDFKTVQKYTLVRHIKRHSHY